MNIPEGILCSKTHEWVMEEDSQAVIGLTDWAVEQLGDIVFIELPEVGASFSKDEVFATIESVKAASEIYMPVGGEILEVNEELINSPELIEKVNNTLNLTKDDVIITMITLGYTKEETPSNKQRKEFSKIVHFE